jgi:signal peptidase II
MKSKLFFFLLSLLVLAADQATKLWATARLKPVSAIEVLPGYFRFSYATNRGVAFSLFADSAFDMRWLLAGIAAAAAVFVATYLLRAPAGLRRLHTALALLLAGIAGNLMDRVRLGEVVDFIEVHWRDQYVWPTFNIADAAICTGAALLALEMMREARAESSAAAIQPVVGDERAD